MDRFVFPILAGNWEGVHCILFFGWLTQLAGSVSHADSLAESGEAPEFGEPFQLSTVPPVKDSGVLGKDEVILGTGDDVLISLASGLTILFHQTAAGMGLSAEARFEIFKAGQNSLIGNAIAAPFVQKPCVGIQLIGHVRLNGTFCGGQTGGPLFCRLGQIRLWKRDRLEDRLDGQNIVF